MLKNTASLLIWFPASLQMRNELSKQFSIQLLQTNVHNFFLVLLCDFKIILSLVKYFNLEIFNFCKPYILALIINKNYIKLQDYSEKKNKGWFMSTTTKISEINNKEQCLEHMQLSAHFVAVSVITTFNLPNTLLFQDILYLLLNNTKISL